MPHLLRLLTGPGEVYSEGHLQNTAVYSLPKRKALFSFLNSSYLLPKVENCFSWTRNRGFFLTKPRGSMLKQFLPTCPAPRACAVSEPVGSAVLLTGLALCQAVSRTGQNCMPPPLPPAGSLVSALDTKTNKLCALAPYSTQGRGGSSKYPSYVNNQEYLAAHLIFCNFISIKVRAFYGWEACPTLSLVPGIALVRGAQSPSWFCSSSVPSDTNCKPSRRQREVEFFSHVPRLFITSCSLPEAETGSHLDGVMASQ